MRISSQQYNELITKHPKLRPVIESSNSHAGTLAKLESNVINDSLATPCIQKGFVGKVLISVKSFRQRLLDEDGLCEKFHVDLCRYASIIPGDSPGEAKIEVSQEKVKSKDQEKVIITIEKI